MRQVPQAKKPKVPKNKRVFALIVESEKKERHRAQRELLKYLGPTTGKHVSQFPNGIRLRFVKCIGDAISTHESGKLAKLRERQKNFLTSILTTKNQDMINLDSLERGNTLTLRQAIMSLESRQFKDTSIFHAVDLDWKGDGYIFQYSPKLKEEAESTIHVLLPYLEGVFPDEN